MGSHSCFDFKAEISAMVGDPLPLSQNSCFQRTLATEMKKSSCSLRMAGVWSVHTPSPIFHGPQKPSAAKKPRKPDLLDVAKEKVDFPLSPRMVQSIESRTLCVLGKCSFKEPFL